MRTAALVSLALVACVPDLPPEWFVDVPRPWGIRATVVVPGPYSSDLVVPDGRERAAALPLDTLELEWLEAVPKDTPKRPPPVWVVCANVCEYEISGFTPVPLFTECPDPLPLSRIYPGTFYACRLGEGQRIRLVLGGAFSAGPGFTASIPILAIGSADPDLAPDTCLERLYESPPHDLEDCLIQMRRLELGPPWKLLAHLPAYGAELPDEFPDDLFDEPADTHPVLEHLHVLLEPGAREHFVRDGDTLPVRPGDRISAQPIFTADSYQRYYPNFGSIAEPKFDIETNPEHLNYVTALDVFVEGYVAAGPNAIEWIAPDGPAPVDLLLYAEDTRQGRLTATFHFVTEVGAE